MKLFSHLFGRTSAAKYELDFLNAQRMVLDYARLLEDGAPMPGRILDASGLPHPKASLQRALLMCISNSSDSRLEEHLKAGYLMLSAFQSDVGDVGMGTDFAALDLDRDVMNIAQQLEQDETNAEAWRLDVRRELEQLKQDLYELELAQPVRLSA